MIYWVYYFQTFDKTMFSTVTSKQEKKNANIKPVNVLFMTGEIFLSKVLNERYSFCSTFFFFEILSYHMFRIFSSNGHAILKDNRIFKLANV